MAYRALPRHQAEVEHVVARSFRWEGEVLQPGSPLPANLTPRRLQQLYFSRHVLPKTQFEASAAPVQTVPANPPAETEPSEEFTPTVPPAPLPRVEVPSKLKPPVKK